MGAQWSQALLQHERAKLEEGARLVPRRRHRGGDYLLIPRLQGSVNVKELDISSFTTEHGRLTTLAKGYPLCFPVNKYTTWLLGLYVAEGSSSSRAFFALGKHERALAAELCGVVRRLGYSPCVYEAQTSLTVEICSRVLARALSVWCGRGAHNKQVPHFILHHKNKEVLSAFLDGYWAGDGCVEHRQYGALRQMAITVSSKLAVEIQLLGARLGHYIHISRKTRDFSRMSRGNDCPHYYFLTYSKNPASNAQAIMRQDFFFVPLMEGDNFSAEQGQLLEIADQKLMNNIKISLESPLEEP